MVCSPNASAKQRQRTCFATPGKLASSRCSPSLGCGRTRPRGATDMLEPTNPPRCPCGELLKHIVADTGDLFERAYQLLQCDVCSLISPDPLPTHDEQQAQYNGYGQYADPEYLRRELERRRSSAKRLLGK